MRKVFGTVTSNQADSRGMVLAAGGMKKGKGKEIVEDEGSVQVRLRFLSAGTSVSRNRA